MAQACAPESDETIAETRGQSTVPKADTPLPHLHFGRGQRLPMIRQSEASECGLACLAMISGYYGQHLDMLTMRSRFSLSLKGMTLARLIEIAQSLGLACRPLRLELDELKDVQIPCILHWDLNHFVVLRTVRKRHVVIHDPAVGERTLTFEELSKHATGVAIEVSKGPDFRRKRQAPPISLYTLAGSIHGLGRGLLTIFGLALALELFGLLAPQFLQMIVDQVLADGDRDLLTFLGLSFLLLLVVQIGVSALRTWTVMWLGTHFSLNWTGNVFQHLLRLPQSYFIKRHLGDVVSRFGAISAIQHTLTTRFVEVVLDGLMTVLTLIVLLFYSPLLTILIVVAIAIYGALRMLYYRVYREANLSQITVQAKQQTSFMEAVRGVQTLRLFNQEPARSARYLNLTADMLNTGVAVQRMNLAFSSAQGLVSGIQRIAVLWVGAWLALKGQFSAGMLMAFAAYADQFSSRASNLVDYIIQWQLIQIQSERLADIVLAPQELHAQAKYIGPPPEPSITFEGVSFRYSESDEWIIKDCSFEIHTGESVAIIGPSGCGKTTLVRLILGLLDPTRGTIRIGGVDLKHLGKIALRNMTASVMQDDTLFAGTIAENIALFDEAATIDRIVEAARMAEIHDEIASFPMGYHTLVGDMGSTLSGGQQQRLHMARALYRNPKMLILDEASSHLDIERETLIAERLKLTSMTRVAVAHRPQTVESADRILACVAGAIVELRKKIESEAFSVQQ